MSAILYIESSSNVCGALLTKGTSRVEQSVVEGFVHSEKLASFVQQVLDEGKDIGLEPQAVVVDAGPGSYTGLRIGAALAKGLCVGYGIPLISVSSLEALASSTAEAELRIGVANANNGRVYIAGYDKELNEVQTPALVDLKSEPFPNWASVPEAALAGDGVAVLKEYGEVKGQVGIDTLLPEYLDAIGRARFQAGEFTNLHAFKPHYIKEFVTTTPKTLNKILGI